MDYYLHCRVILLDLDGVLTTTRDLHFRAWKNIFEPDLPFSENDYARYVDGKTRLDGILSFTSSRGLNLTDKETHDLLERKNQIYLELLEKNPPRLFSDVLPFLNRMKAEGKKLGIVSSSENCRKILSLLGIEDFFEVCVDGLDGKKLGLKGKPSPEYLQEAMKRFSASAGDCALIEDSTAGIEAAKNAHIHFVFGMARPGQTHASVLYRAGATRVVSSFDDVFHPLNPLNQWKDFEEKVGDREVALFLDFDGTLSEIVPHPEDAVLKEKAREVLSSLSKATKIAVVSGRDRLDVKNRVNIPGLFYAGCHGYDMSGPGCFHYTVEGLKVFSDELENISLEAKTVLEQIPGVIVERKLYGTSIHYRLADEKLVPELKQKVSGMIDRFSSLKLREGKKVLEIIPKLSWGKGEAILKLISILNINPEKIIPVYIGDDSTDEEAFHVMKGAGITIRVNGHENVSTEADYVLEDPSQVVSFLNLINDNFNREEKLWRNGH